MTTMPASATKLASNVLGEAASRSQSQAMAAAANGCAAMMIATFATFVSCSAGIKFTMPSVESNATSHAFGFIAIRLRTPRTPWVRTKNSAIKPPPNSPRQNRMVQESY